MLVFWKARLVLFAVPKTGTTALEAALAPMADIAIVNPPGLKHCNIRKYRRELAPFVEQGGRRPFQHVAVMREPLDWLGSWYRYRSRPALNGHPNSTANMDFEDFIQAHLLDEPPDFARVGRQARFLDGGVDHLFSYDHPEPFHTFLEARIGPLPSFGRENVSPSVSVTLADETRARLRAARSEDFALWADVCRAHPGDP
ncbi:MAG: gamma-glutamyl kinase [Pseudomonadota bacterium]